MATQRFVIATLSLGGELGADTFSARWTGQVDAPVSGTYTFYTASDDGVRLWVNGVPLVDNWTLHSLTENSGTIVLTAGQRYAIRMEFFERAGAATARLLWSSASIPKAVVPSTRLYPGHLHPGEFPAGVGDRSVRTSDGRGVRLRQPRQRADVWLDARQHVRCTGSEFGAGVVSGRPGVLRRRVQDDRGGRPHRERLALQRRALGRRDIGRDGERRAAHVTQRIGRREQQAVFREDLAPVMAFVRAAIGLWR
jgi:hypothetical protein